jgi:hypothetical protein
MDEGSSIFLRDMGLIELRVPVPPAPKDIDFDIVDLVPEMDELAQSGGGQSIR